MRTITEIIIHCSATRPGMDIGARDIRRWHVEERGWRDIGYHYVIRRNGTVEKGRDESVIGAHCKGRNAHSLGVCLVGGLSEKGSLPEDNFTPSQYQALADLLRSLAAKYPGISVHPHSDYAKKPCPCFNVREFLHSINWEEK